LSPSLHLNNVLVSPQLIKNLKSVRQFTTDNNFSVEFDPSGCSVKDLLTWNVIVRCNSSGSLYPLRLPAAAHPSLPAPRHLFGIVASVTLVMKPCPSSLPPFLRVPRMLALQCVMLVNLVATLVYSFMCHHHGLFVILILYIVICGRPQS
jgi:hypothetical protein